MEDKEEFIRYLGEETYQNSKNLEENQKHWELIRSITYGDKCDGKHYEYYEISNEMFNEFKKKKEIFVYDYDKPRRVFKLIYAEDQEDNENLIRFILKNGKLQKTKVVGIIMPEHLIHGKYDMYRIGYVYVVI